MTTKLVTGNPNQHSGNLKDMEAKINSLERANFDLKMKLHYLNKKYATAGNENVSVENGMMMMGDTQIDIIAMKEENEYSKRRILELESELLQLQLIRDREAHEFQKALKVKQQQTPQELDENRKREREVAKAIAEHDAALIKKLQEEATILQKQREKDKELVDTLTNELAKTKLLLEEKEKEVEELTTKNKDLTLKIELLREDREYNENGHYDRSSIMNGAPVPYSPSRGPPGNGRRPQGPPMLFSANTNGQQTSILINSSAFTAASSVGAPPAAAAPSPYHPYGHPAPAQPPSTFLLQTHPHQPALPPPATPAYPSQYPGHLNQSFNGSMMMDNGTGANPHDLPVVYQENQVLRDRLSKLQESIQTQEKIIHNMKTSAKEFNLIESEEIKRLEKELDKVIDEKEKLRQKCQKLEIEVEIMTQQLQQYRRYYGPLDISALSAANPFQQQQLRQSSLGYQSMQRNILEIQQYERAIEQYKSRESELVAALEGVVKRCQELEKEKVQYQMRLKLLK